MTGEQSTPPTSASWVETIVLEERGRWAVAVALIADSADNRVGPWWRRS